MRSKFKNKIFAILLLFTLTPIFLISSLVIFYQYKNGLQNVQETNKLKIESISRVLKDSIFDVKSTIEIVGEQYISTDLSPKEFSQIMKTCTVKKPLITQIVVTDEKGAIIRYAWGKGDDDFVALYLDEVKKGLSYISGVEYFYDGTTQAIIVGAPIFKDNVFVGSVGAVVDMKLLNSYIAEEMDDEFSEFLVVDLKGAALTVSKQLGVRGDSFHQNEAVKNVLSQKMAGTLEYVLGDDRKVFASFAYIDSLQYSVIVQQPQNRVFTPIYLTVALVFSIALVFVLFVVVCARKSASYLLKPIDVLRRSIEHIASGTDDTGLYEPLHNDSLLNRNDEFGILAAGYNRMIGAIKRREEDLIGAKEKAEEASASQSRFIANMSHEIRTPLNAILGYAEVLKGSNNKEKIEYYLGAIDTSGKILLDIVTDILDFSKVSAGKHKANYVPCKLDDFLEELKILFWKNADTKGIDLELVYDPSLPALELPLSIIRQVMINLVGNAIKFTDKGTVIIKAECQKQDDIYDIKFHVIDTGIGIAQEKQKFIFKAFEQVEESHENIGTGLGLAISTKFAEIVGAKINLESEIGTGSTFTLHIQNIEVSDAELESVYGKNNSIDFEFMDQMVMIVDDIKDNVDVLKAHCENLNLQSKAFTSPQEALGSLKFFEPDIILTDLRMPTMNGEEFAEIIRKSHPDIPILCITASMNPDERYELDCFDEVLNKPIASSVLAESMARYIQTQSKEEGAKSFDIKKVFHAIVLSQQEQDELKSDCLETVKKLKKVMNLEKVKELGGTLEKHNNSDLQMLGQTLTLHRNSLNVSGIVETVHLFYEYLDKECNG